MPGVRVVTESIFLKSGKICKRVQMLQDNLGYSIIEQDFIEDRFKPVGAGHKWHTVYFVPSTTRNIARSEFVGRLAIIAYEEGNKEEPEENQVRQVMSSDRRR